MKKKSNVEISTEIVNLTKYIASNDIKVCVSSLIMRENALEKHEISYSAEHVSGKTNKVLRKWKY